MQELIKTLNEATEAYDRGFPIISDKEWDALYFKLKDLEERTGIVYPNSPTQKIEYNVVTELKKVEHNHPLLSLDKTKDFSQFLSYFGDRDAIGMLKLDGLTCSLRYINGELVGTETRGNGIIGEDILHNARTIFNIPQKINYKEELIVDGEVICTYKNFENFAGEYANPRNFAAGSIRLLDPKECAKRNLSFIVWNVHKGFNNINSFSKRLDKVQEQGFTVVPWVSSLDWGDGVEYLKEEAKNLGYPYDGLVARFDDIAHGESLGSTGHHTKAAYAFKFYDEEYETYLKDIDWTMGRKGTLCPVAVFNDVNTGDSVINRASLHNLSVMEDLLGTPYWWQKIVVIKSNDIIPQIIWGDKESYDQENEIEIPKICPYCGHPVEIIEENASKFLYCTNPLCETKIINQLDHFVGNSGLNIRGLSKATLEYLHYWEYIKSSKDIFELRKYATDWKSKPGFGEKSVENILSAIDKVRDCELSSFICSLGIPLVGKTVSKDIAKRVDSWEDFRKLIDSNFDFTTWNGYGLQIDKELKEFNYDEADYIVDNFLNLKNSAKAQKTNLQGLNIVITGSLKNFKNRAELQNKIESLGGKISSSVSSKTSYLINNNIESTSGKNATAKKLNIPIISEEEFIKKFLQL